MTFIDAALSLLQKSRKALTAEQLAEKADQSQLLSTPGKDPLRSMKAALTRELKKGDASRVVAVEGDHWQVAATAADASAPAKPAKKKAATKAKSTEAAKSAPAAKKKAASKTSAKKTAAKKTASKKTAAKKTEPKKTEAIESPAAEVPESAQVSDSIEGAAPAETGKKRRSRRRTKKTASVVEQAASVSAVEAETSAVEAQPAEAEAAAEAGLTGEATADAGAEVADETSKKRRNRRSRRKRRGNREDIEAVAAEAVEPEPEPVSVEQLGDILAPKEMPVRADVPVTPDDAEIQAIYGDELSGIEPGAAFAEYKDEMTEDEDRPMSPELVSTRPDRQKRERRRRRERPRGEAAATRPQPQAERSPEPRPEARPAAPATPTSAPEAAPTATPTADLYRPGNRLAAHATTVLHGAEQQTLRGKQLARLMSSRGLLAGSPEAVWPHLESALIHDERSHVARGMRPRVVARGRGAFEALAQSDRELAASENALATAIQSALSATHAAFAKRLTGLELSELERMAHVFLLTQGYNDIVWIKRSQHSSYAVAVAPGGLGDILVGIRAGSEPVDRSGIGELRVGVQAKKLTSGLLLAPSPLSDAARQELRRNGPSLSVLVGDAFVSSLIHAGIGVTLAQVAVPFIDEPFLAALRDTE